MDIVIVGQSEAAVEAARAAAAAGQRVLVVMRLRPARVAARLRRRLGAVQGLSTGRLITVITGSQVVCVDGVRSVEAVVIRRLRTGRLIAVNAATILTVRRRRGPHVGEAAWSTFAT